MKGISTILATIMIVIIVVALVSLTYTFAVNLFGSSTKPIESSVTQTNQKIDQRVSFIVDPSCQKIGSSWQISFSIRHEGATYNISSAMITALFGNDPGTLSGWGSDDMAPGTVKSLTFTNSSAVNWSETADLTVSAPASPISATVTCP
jgi:hypothetical protein